MATVPQFSTKITRVCRLTDSRKQTTWKTRVRQPTSRQR